MTAISAVVDGTTITYSAGPGTIGVPNGGIALAKLANVATDSLLGRDTAGTGVPEVLTVGGGLEFSGSGSIRRAALAGDVTAAAGSGTTAIADDAVTYAKMQDVSATDRLLGRSTAGAGVVEEIVCTAAARALLDDTTAAAMLTTLGAAALAGAIFTGRARAADAAFAPSAGAASLDVSASNDFHQTNTITQVTTLTLTNGADGDQGTVVVQQNGTGYAVTFAASGCTVKYVGGSVPTSASALISCGYKYCTVNSIALLLVYPVVLS